MSDERKTQYAKSTGALPTGSKTLRDRAVRTLTDLDVLVCPNRNWTVSPSRSHTCMSVRLDRHDYEHRSRGKWCVEKRRRLKSRLQKSEEEIPKIGLWIRLTRKQSAKRCSTRHLPTPFLPAMRHRPCRIQAKILSRSRHFKALEGGHEFLRLCNSNFMGATR